MEALGLIETKGLIGAIESADVMLKAADVSLLDRTYVTGGLVAITVTGEVAAVKAAVDAGAAAVGKIAGQTLVSQHVIPRPHPEMEGVIVPSDRLAGIQEEPKVIAEEAAPAAQKQSKLDRFNKTDVDQLAKSSGLEEALKMLEQMKVVELRNLAREYEGFGIAGRTISKANKKPLLDSFRTYYQEKE